MFRLFLRKKIFSGTPGARSGGASSPPSDTSPNHRGRRDTTQVDQHGQSHGIDPSGRRNRRVFERYAVDHKHLTLMNEQDILLVRELSAKGFSTEVSPRGYERLVIGDIYDARIRYLGEIYDLQAKVTWKQEAFVGFEITKAGRDTLVFIKRLLRPVEIAASLQPVDASFLAASSSGKTWYHGDDDTDLYVWHHAETNELSAWQLAIADQYIEWNVSRGLTTGSLNALQGHEAMAGHQLPGLTHREDQIVDPQKRQLALDVIMALPFPIRDDILDTVLS